MSCRNIPPLEQIARVIVAVILLAYSFVMKPPVALSAILALFAVVLIYTAFTEYCPLKEVLGLHRCRAVSVSGQTTKGKRAHKESKEKKAKKGKKESKAKRKKSSTAKTAKKSKKTTKKTSKSKAKGKTSKGTKGKKAKKSKK